MEEGSIKNVIKCVFFGVIWSILIVIISVIITEFKEYIFNDVIFVQGMILIVVGLLSSMGGNPMGLSIEGIGSQSAQYITNANLEVTKYEKERLNIKTTITIGLSGASLVVGGLLSIIISFI